MVCSVFLPDEIVSTDVRIKKPFRIDTKHVFSIKYGKENSSLVVQFDNVHMCYKPTVDIYENISILVQLGQESTSCMEGLEQHVYNKIQGTKHKALIASRSLVCNLKPDKCLMRSRNHVDNIACYDKKGGSIKHTVLDSGHAICLIILVDSMWASAECYGYNYKVVQIKSMEDQIVPCFEMFHNPLERYERMLRMGVPPAAVMQKMVLESVAEDVRESFAKAHSKPHAAPPPPPPGRPPPPPPPMGIPPPPPAPMAVARGGSGRPEFLNNIEMGTFKLKKIDKESQELDKRAKILKNVNTDVFAPPTLDAILNMRSRLKCLDKVYHSYYVRGATCREPQ